MGKFIVAGLCLALVNAGGSELKGDGPKAGRPASIKPPENTEATCGNHGTSVDFVSTPSEAAQQAKKEQKLVFVLHVSGHFEDPKLT